jgi:anti-sigma-K factor RskA
MEAATVARVFSHMQFGRFFDAYTKTTFMSLVTFNSELRVFGVWQFDLTRSQDGRFHGMAYITEVFEQTYNWQSKGLWRLTVDASTAVILLANIAVVLFAWNERFNKMWARKASEVQLPHLLESAVLVCTVCNCSFKGKRSMPLRRGCTCAQLW